MSEIRYGFTGTRDGMTPFQRFGCKEILSGTSGEVHHGDCVGSDSDMHDIADASGYAIVIHPPSNYALRAWREVPRHMMRAEAAYTDRNRAIVNATEALIATPAEAEEQLRGGTWATIRYARKIGKPIFIVRPDGSIRQEGGRKP